MINAGIVFLGPSCQYVSESESLSSSSGTMRPLNLGQETCSERSTGKGSKVMDGLE